MFRLSGPTRPTMGQNEKLWLPSQPGLFVWGTSVTVAINTSRSRRAVIAATRSKTPHENYHPDTATGSPPRPSPAGSQLTSDFLALDSMIVVQRQNAATETTTLPRPSSQSTADLSATSRSTRRPSQTLSTSLRSPWSAEDKSK